MTHTSLKMLKDSTTIALVPHPSDDPRDPLVSDTPTFSSKWFSKQLQNWSMKKKIPIVAALCLATFANFSSGLAGQLSPGPQAKLYGVDTTKIAYQNSFSNGGMIAGALILFPLSHIFGRSSVIFWSTVATCASQIWAACMTHSTQYVPYLGSRFVAGFFEVSAGILGPRMLFDLFFLHQRGRAFTYFHFALEFGTVASPTLSAFISTAGHDPSWTYAFWWTAGLTALAAIMVFFFVYETAWDRSEGADNDSIATPEGFFASKIATFFPGTKVTKSASIKQTLEVAVRPFLIAASPPMLLLGFFVLFNFGFYVAMNSITPVWLQKPVKAGGYGFTLRETALCE
jgi:MFS family permease